MSLHDAIEQLRRDTLAALDETYYFFANTKHVWRVVQQDLRQEDSEFRFTIKSRSTGGIVDEGELEGLVQTYVGDFLPSATLQQLLSIFEEFLFAFLRKWLRAYPKHLRRATNKKDRDEEKKVKLSTILECNSLDDVISTVIERTLASLSYENIPTWFEFLDKLMRHPHRLPNDQDKAKLAELKASRNVLVHNGGIANATYVKAAGRECRYTEGKRIQIPETYLHESWQLLKKTVADVADGGISKSQA